MMRGILRVLARPLKYLSAKYRIDRELARVYIACFIVFPANAYSVAMLFPFLSAMTSFYLPGTSTASINRYAGIVVGAFFAGRILGSFIWGSLADHFGRKPILILSASLMAMSSLVLAFSISYGMTVAFRIILGFCSGVFVVTRAVISESSTDINHTFGFSVLTCSWLVSALLAPLLSGLSADPITQYNLTLPDGTLKSYLTKFPYSPPFLLNTLVCIAGVLAVIILLPETLDKAKQKRLKLQNQMSNTDMHEEDESGSTTGVLSDIHDKDQSNSEPASNERSTGSENVYNVSSNMDSTALNESNKKDDIEMQHFLENVQSAPGPRPQTLFEKCQCAVQNARTGIRKWFIDVKFILFNRVTLLIFLAHCFFAVVDTGFEALYSLWCATPLNLGGIGFSVREIGLTSTVVGALFLPFSLFAYPFLERKVGSINSFQTSAILNVFVCVSLPNIHFLALTGSSVALWLVIVVIRLIFIIGARICFAAQCVFISNSVTHEKLGRANGLAVLMSDIFRAISPAITGTIYAASLSQQAMSFGFPVNYYLMFVVFGGLLLTMVLLTACLPHSINYKKNDGVH